MQKKISFTVILATLSLYSAIGQAPAIDKVTFFTDTSILTATLVTYMNKILGSPSASNLVYAGRFTCRNAEGSAITQPVQIELRGHLRREYCFMPPLRINFNPGDTSQGALSTLKSLKLVNCCMQNNLFTEYVLKEYLVYKIYNLLTDKSFRVRLLSMEYVDSSGKKKPLKNYAFFLEDAKAMAKRNHCTDWMEGKPATVSINRKEMTLVSLFEYMIGNTDWSVPVRHNIKTIRPKEDSTAMPFAVPYDFDYAGLVGTNYAVPDPLLNIKSVEERVYRGYPRTLAELNEAFSQFNQQKDSIYSLIKNFELLSVKTRNYMISYLDGFYKTINDPREVKAIFINGDRID